MAVAMDAVKDDATLFGEDVPDLLRRDLATVSVGCVRRCAPAL